MPSIRRGRVRRGCSLADTISGSRLLLEGIGEAEMKHILSMLDGKTVPVEDVEAAIERAIEAGGVPGLSCASS